MNRAGILLLVVLLTVTGCSTIRGLAGYESPDVSYKDVSVEGISLESIDLMFHFEVDNPNRAGVKLEEYIYSLSIDESDFLSGTHTEQLEVGSQARGTVSLPLTLSYKDLYESVSSVVRSDSFSFALDTEVLVDIPVYGNAKIPVSVEGNLPLLRMPEVAFSRFEVHDLSFSAVDVSIYLNVSNPNPLGVTMSDLNLGATVSGTELADISVGDISIESGEYAEVPVRFSFAFGDLGSTVMDMLRGNRKLEYEIRGEGDVKIDHPAFNDKTRLPFYLIGDYMIGD